jgi:putative acetyltransferase
MSEAIRPAAEGDTEAIVAVWRGACAASYGFLPSGFVQGYEEWLRGGVLNAHDTLVVDDGAVRAFLLRQGQFVGSLFVEPARQGQGLGRRLLDAAKEASPVLLTSTFAQNERAVRFYQREGFAATAVKIHRETGENIVFFRWNR